MGLSERSRSVWITALIGLAVIQAGALAVTTDSRSESPAPGPLGAAFGEVRLTGEGGASASVANGQPTVVLVFHSACGHCRTVAPDWADWLATRDPDLRVIAVSREPHESAVAYADSFGWQVEVWVTEPTWFMPKANALTARTPWIYGLDATGRVVAAAHGSEIRTVAEAIEALGLP